MNKAPTSQRLPWYLEVGLVGLGLPLTVIIRARVSRVSQGRINHLGAPYRRKVGPFSHMHSHNFLRGALCKMQQVDDLF